MHYLPILLRKSNTLKFDGGLGPNQDIDELYVDYIPAGAPLNPDNETDVGYPGDVIQLTGSRIVI